MRHLRAIAVLFAAAGAAAVSVRARAEVGTPLPGMMALADGLVLPAELGASGRGQGFEVGSWVEYRLRRLGRASDTREVLLRLALTSQQGDELWLEMIISDDRGGRAVTRMLVDSRTDAEAGTPVPGGRLRRLIIQHQRQIPLEIPVDSASAPVASVAEAGSPGALIGTESVRVGSRHVSARHFRRGSGGEQRDVWISDGVSLWGLVRYRGPRLSMTLVAQGTGATSSVTGEPIAFDPGALR